MAAVHSYRQRLAAWVNEGAAISLGGYLLMALLLRLPAVLCADGFEYPDQQYQNIDPAWHLAGGAWYPTWEWAAGMRSWVYPGALAAVFRGLSWLGFEDPMWTMRAVRFVHALFSLLPMWMFWLVVVRWRPLERPRLPLLLFAMSGLLVLQVQPWGPACAGVLAVTAALAVHGPRWFPAFGGLCLGFAFCGRFQEALFGPGLLVILCWQRRWSAALWFCLGCVPGIATEGFVDMQMGGGFLSTPLAYLQSNVVEGAAERWRTQPWWFYWLAAVVPVLALVPPFLRVAWQRLREGSLLLPAATAAALGHLLAHSFIARKALRFEFASLAMLLAVVLVGLRAARGRLATWHLRVLVLVHLGLFLWASFSFGSAGAVRSALWLRAQSDCHEVFVVDAPLTTLGGSFYMRLPAARVRVVELEQLPALAAKGELPVGAYLFTSYHEPGHELDLARAAPVQLELERSFPGQFALRRGELRLVYRRRR